MSALSLGIDTSNYTTSIALVDENENIIYNQGILLDVKSGERGLRQSDALFQHVKNLPILFKDLPRGKEIQCICYSQRPRPLEDSYMPVFRSGEALGLSLAGVLNCNALAVSHQENHIRAAIYGSGSPELEDQFCGVHFSGGTSEILVITKNGTRFKCDIIAKTLDLNAGQLIDRIAVLMGYGFPGGQALEILANQATNQGKECVISSSMDGVDFHFSGQENQAKTYLEKGVNPSELAYSVFKSIAKTLSKSIRLLQQNYGFQSVVFSGGVMSNQLIKTMILKELAHTKISLFFTEGKYARDNAVGNALLGMDALKKLEGDDDEQSSNS